jgi:hypothetical protein
MAVSNDTTQAQIQALTQRVNEMATALATVTPLTALASNASFLESLSRLPHQTTSNTSGTDGYGGGRWTAGQQSSLLTLQAIVNGVVNAVNILQSHLQSNGFES